MNVSVFYAPDVVSNCKNHGKDHHEGKRVPPPETASRYRDQFNYFRCDLCGAYFAKPIGSTTTQRATPAGD